MQRRGFFPYGPTKAALEAATYVWSQDLEGTGVTANVLIPGRAADTAIMPDDWRKSGIDRRGLPPAPPEVMGPPILWFASDESDDVNGMRLPADQWDDSLPPDEAARKIISPVGFELRQN